MEYAITKLSTKGQIVIPSHMRRGMKKGEEFLIVRNKKNIIMKSVKSLASDLEEDLEYIKRIDQAWEDYDKGKFVKMSKEAFLKELKKW
jgi:bifunctional DNA-binding transcriptional regulator/antitoxin component of YhaV-PrlF toxin-antitoxin module